MKAESDKKKKDEKPALFTPKREFELKLGWPSIYPEHRTNPIVFHMRTQLVSEAEEVQRTFLMLPDAETTSELQHKHDVEMLALLSTAPPEGFKDFPAVNGDAGAVAKAIREYFLPEEAERREGMKFICRSAMSRYWQAVMPAEYL